MKDIKKAIILPTIVAASLCAQAQTPADSAATDTCFVFTEVISLPSTSVKDQNKSGTCWSFAGTSFFENEIRRAGGDSLDISEMYTVRRCFEDKAERYIRMNGATNFAAGGSILDVPYVWNRYGALPEQVYPGIAYGEDKHVHAELDAVLTAYVKAVASNPNKRISTAWRDGLNGILDAYLGKVPETFTYNGRTYTPESFAAAQPLKTSDFVALTSFTHHPQYSQFPLEVADNWLWGQYWNLPLDEFKAVVDNSLAKGYTVVWAADVSEPGFRWTDGVALMPKGKQDSDLEGTELARWVKLSDKDRENERYSFSGPVEEIEVTPESRQQMFDRQETTDDHGMEIVGVATDQKGNRYYKVKNSWDTNQKYDGYFYVSEPYFLAKTLSILVNRKALPENTARKLNLR